MIKVMYITEQANQKNNLNVLRPLVLKFWTLRTIILPHSLLFTEMNNGQPKNTGQVLSASFWLSRVFYSYLFITDR